MVRRSEAIKEVGGVREVNHISGSTRVLLLLLLMLLLQGCGSVKEGEAVRGCACVEHLVMDK